MRKKSCRASLDRTAEGCSTHTSICRYHQTGGARQPAQRYCKIKPEGRDASAAARRAFQGGFPGFPLASGLAVHCIHHRPCPCGNRTDRCAIKFKQSRSGEMTHGSWTENRKNGGPQEGNGHQQEHRLSKVRQDHAHCEAHERSPARDSGRNLYFVLGVRVLRKTVRNTVNSDGWNEKLISRSSFFF